MTQVTQRANLYRNYKLTTNSFSTTSQKKALFEKALERFKKSSEKNRTYSYLPSMIEISRDLDLYDFSGKNFFDRVESVLKIPPTSESINQLSKINQEYNEKRNRCISLSTTLNKFKLKPANTSPDLINLNYILPTNYKNKSYNSFIKCELRACSYLIPEEQGGR